MLLLLSLLLLLLLLRSKLKDEIMIWLLAVLRGLSNIFVMLWWWLLLLMPTDTLR